MTAVAESGGTWLTVSDDEIMSACSELAAATGVFAEPAGAAAFAGILRGRERGVLSANDSVLHVVTGSGLKDVQNATARAPEPHEIQPSLDEVQKVIGKLVSSDHR
jgi:threonine synthase